MEMMIATAILAGSGVALFGLVGQASQLARRAEERTAALQLAQSTLDEFLANGSESGPQDETEGSFESDPRWAYRIDQSDVEGIGQVQPQLKRINVSIYRSSPSGGPSLDTTGSAIVSLIRWSRATKPRSASSSDPASSSNTASPEISSSEILSSPSFESMSPASSIPEALRSP